jgi:hypothetical protein
MLVQRRFLFVTHVSVKFNGGFKCAGTVKIRGFDTFSRCRSRDGGYRVKLRYHIKSRPVEDTRTGVYIHSDAARKLSVECTVNNS